MGDFVSVQENLNLTAFGKNDIRGIFPSEVNSELFFHTARGYVKWVSQKLTKAGVSRKPDKMCFVVCMDARLHSPELKNAVIEGLTTAGANVFDIDMAPTPVGYFGEYAMFDDEYLEGSKITGAFIVTASHNPSEYNGLKITFNKASLDEDDFIELKEKTREVFDLSREGRYSYYKKGWVKKPDIINMYMEKLLSSSHVEGVKIVTDCANATAGLVAPELYRRLGAEVIELFTEPDGNFPNHHPNPSVEATLESLKKKVVEENADFGIAFDGDSDRIGVVDNEGRMITGDKLLLIYAKDLINDLKIHGETPSIVSEVKCSQVLYDEIEKLGANAIMCKTGHGYIKAKMRETGALLAGEMSGHIFFKDRYFGFDDAIYAGCRLIEIFAKNKKKNSDFKLKELLLPFEKVSVSDEIRLNCPNNFKTAVLENIAEITCDETFGEKIKEIIKIDGLRFVFDDGFALIRQSNTEPVFTLRFEAKTKDKCLSYQNALVGLCTGIIEKIKAIKV
ncbi:MAG: phosphomannomutase/phosphoglucomutase [Candidatus Gastranaerophilales bacterium]|nr:phosphomannomutase/phosphoglucomutase [Candidatus Gastranaerophilales bacterium]